MNIQQDEIGYFGFRESQSFSTVVNGDYGWGETSMGADYTITMAALDESVTIPAGTYEGCAHVAIEISGELIGGVMTTDLWAHPEAFMLRLVAFFSVEAQLSSPWS